MSAPKFDEMTRKQVELWDEAFLRFRARRFEHLKLVLPFVAVFLFIVLPLNLWLLPGITDGPNSGGRNHPTWYFLAAPFLYIIYLAQRLRYNSGYSKAADGTESYSFRYHHKGDLRADFLGMCQGLANEALQSQSGCVGVALKVAGALIAVGAALFIPYLFYIIAVIVGLFYGYMLLGVYLWFSPFEEEWRQIHKIAAHNEGLHHVRGATVTQMPDASTSSPIKPEE